MMGKRLRDLAEDEIRLLGPRLKTGPGLLLHVIAGKVRDDIGELWASERTVAGWVGRSQPTYRKWRAELIDAGLLKRLGGRPGVAARYKLFPPPSENPGVITPEFSTGDNPSEQKRKPVRTIEPHRTSTVLNKESDDAEGSFDEELSAVEVTS